jgi:hypothetical protein
VAGPEGYSNFLRFPFHISCRNAYIIPKKALFYPNLILYIFLSIFPSFSGPVQQLLEQ